MQIETISQLNSKAWYRLLKVIFIVAFSIVWLIYNLIVYYSGISVVGTISDTQKSFFTIGNLIIFFVFEGIRRVFYYIVLGTIKPEK